jgi:hypothetical protein
VSQPGGKELGVCELCGGTWLPDSELSTAYHCDTCENVKELADVEPKKKTSGE